jgi:hypothetical protein
MNITDKKPQTDGRPSQLKIHLHITCQEFTQRTSAYFLIHASTSFCEAQALVPILLLSQVPELRAYKSGFTRPMLFKEHGTH